MYIHIDAFTLMLLWMCTLKDITEDLELCLAKDQGMYVYIRMYINRYIHTYIHIDI
jgi:hypothetical protein